MVSGHAFHQISPASDWFRWHACPKRWKNIDFPVLQLLNTYEGMQGNKLNLLLIEMEQIIFLNCLYRYWGVLVKIAHKWQMSEVFFS